MAQQASFIEELMAAGRGVFALLVGDRNASRFFDFSRRGLAGSFIAILVVVALGAVLPVLVANDHSGMASSVIQLLVLYGLEVGFVAIVLRQINRMDGLVPYLVSYNWLQFFGSLILAALLSAGVDTGALLLVIAVVVIVIEVNIGRIVMALTPLQIAMLLVAQLIGVGIAALLLTVIFPVPPDVAAQLTAS